MTSFWQYKVYADIRGGSLDRGRQTTVGWRKQQFSVLSVLISLEALEMRPTLLYTVNRVNIALPANFERKR